MDYSNVTPLFPDAPSQTKTASSNGGAAFLDDEPKSAPNNEKNDDIIVDASPEPLRDKFELGDDFRLFDDEEENDESKKSPRRGRRPSKRANAVARYVWERFLERVPARQIAQEIGMSPSGTLKIIKRLRMYGLPEPEPTVDDYPVRCPVCGYETPPPCSVCEARRRGVPVDGPDDAFDESEFDLNLSGDVLKRYWQVRREKEKTFEKRNEKRHAPQKRGRKLDSEKYRWQ